MLAWVVYGDESVIECATLAEAIDAACSMEHAVIHDVEVGVLVGDAPWHEPIRDEWWS